MYHAKQANLVACNFHVIKIRISGELLIKWVLLNVSNVNECMGSNGDLGVYDYVGDVL